MTDESPAVDRFARRLRGALRRDAKRLLTPGPSTVPMLMLGPQVPDDAQVQQVIDLCMRIGEIELSSGESVDEVTATMLRLANAAGLPAVDVDITFTSITICCHRGNAAQPVTSMRLVRYRTLDLSRLAETEQVVNDVEAGLLDVRAASARVSEVARTPHPYPRWVATVGWAGLAASIALLLGGGVLTATAASVTTAVIDRIGRQLSRWGVPTFFQQTLGGFLATMSALMLMAANVFGPGARPSFIVAAGITVLLSGLSVVSTVQDALSGYYLTASARIVEISLLSAGLLTGVVIGLQISFTLHQPLEVSGDLPSSVGQFGLSVLAGATSSVFYALAGYAPLRSLPLAGLVGSASWLVYGLLTQTVGVGQIPATGLAALVVGLAAGLLRRGTRTPPMVVTLAGVTPLLPGLQAYRGFYQLAVDGAGSQGLVTITLALAVGLALAAGVALGQFITRPRRRPEEKHQGAEPGASGGGFMQEPEVDDAADTGATMLDSK
ncbi:threonine/serine exporter family protein [Pseudonocardia phyllosphaerae]|uniref:threonine/serine ThrE exporter family protein n=1 Tax=Pseudonocardia phyllosphaerae TaxID=3390502 RepID=UPI00397D2B63